MIDTYENLINAIKSNKDVYISILERDGETFKVHHKDNQFYYYKVDNPKNGQIKVIIDLLKFDLNDFLIA